MSQNGKGIVRVLLAVAALIAIVAIALLFWFRANVLSIYEKASRKALVEVGLERVELETPFGPLVYWTGGEGPLLVLIHGTGHQAGVWGFTAEALLANYRVVVPDLPGHYLSEPQTGPLSMDVLYGGLEALIEAEGAAAGAAHGAAAPAILVGNSLGAWLATIQAHRHPDTVARVIAVNGGALFNDPGELSLVPEDRAQARKLVSALRDPANEAVPDFVLDDLVERSPTGPAARMMLDWESLKAHLLDGRLGEIETPVDLVWGESDKLMTLDYARRLERELPNARLTTIPTCGHMPHTECPDRFNETLGRVLAMDPPVAEVVAGAEEGAPTDDLEPGDAEAES